MERNRCGLGVRDSDEMLSTGRGAGCDPTARSPPGARQDVAGGGCGTPRLQPTAPASLEGAHGRRHRGKKKKKTNHQKKKTNCKQGFNLCSVAACTRHGVGSDCCRNLGCTTLGRAPGAARPRPLPRAGLLAEPASSRGVLGVAGSSPKDHQQSQPELISNPAARRISCAAAGKKKKKVPVPFRKVWGRHAPGCSWIRCWQREDDLVFCTSRASSLSYISRSAELLPWKRLLAKLSLPPGI